MILEFTDGFCEHLGSETGQKFSSTSLENLPVEKSSNRMQTLSGYYPLRLIDGEVLVIKPTIFSCGLKV